MQTQWKRPGTTMSYPMPTCPDDMQKLFIVKLSSEVKGEAHMMLSERRADFMVNADLTYANCRFEDLLPEHFLKLMMVTNCKDILLKREASKGANLGATELKLKHQGHDLLWRTQLV